MPHDRIAKCKICHQDSLTSDLCSVCQMAIDNFATLGVNNDFLVKNIDFLRRFSTFFQVENFGEFRGVVVNGIVKRDYMGITHVQK